jgi:hypothetical protein
LYLSFFFAWSSFSWTCAIAFHAHLVLRTGLVADTAKELYLEKRYAYCVAVVMLVFLFAGVDFYFAEGGTTGFHRIYFLLTVLLALQWVWVSGIVVHMHCGHNGAPTAEMKAYRKQVLLFLFAFLLLTVQAAAFFILLATGAYNRNNKADYYLYYFGYAFLEYVGVVNALLWGVSHTCVVDVINTYFGVDDGISSNSTNGLEMPLIAHEH